MRYAKVISAIFLCTTTISCEKKPEKLAPVASALATPSPAAALAETFVLDKKDSGVSFTMEAELERISGRAPGAASGELFIDLKDLEKSTGLIKVDLDKLSVYKQNRDGADKEYGEEERNEKQNKDMRTWFQITEDTPQELREENRWVEFKLSGIDNASPKDVTQLKGAERKATVVVRAELRLHGRVARKTLKAELVFSFDGDKPTGVSIKTVEPFRVGLEEHDVKPRKTFDQLADATLDALGAKVSKVAEVSIDAQATAK
jgi:hypothetical protein